MEYLQGGDLHSDINKRIDECCRYTDRQIAFIILQVAKAIQYLHANNICHRDIKPENIMFVNGPPGVADGRIKIIDFGTASKFHQHMMFNETYGSPNYIAPEVINSYYREKCDVWSLGIIMYLLLTLK